MKKIILTIISALVLGLILSNISCEKLEVKRVIKIKTIEYLNVTSNSAEVKGTLLDVGENGIIDWGFCYTDISGEPDINSSKVSPTGSPGKGDFTALIEGLEPDMEYHVKAFARSESEVKYGTMLTFTTLVAKEITISSPVSTDVWPLNSTNEIRWTDNLDEDVRIELWRDGDDHSYLEITGAAFTGTQTWTVPNNLPVNESWKIRIVSTNDESIFAFSELFFISEAQYIEVIGPSGNQYVHMGNTYNIDFSSNISGNVKITLFKNDIIHSDIITSWSTMTHYNWTIPNDGSIMAGADYSINISSVDDPNIYDTGTWFEIAEAPFISISEPNGGSSWHIGDTRQITWSDNIVESVRIELFKGGTLETEIANNEPSDGSYDWTIPSGMTIGSDYTIKITGVVNGYTAESAQFTITEPTITVTEPTLGADWQMASNYNITWTSNIGDNIKIDLYKGGSLVTVNGNIISVTANSGSYTWAISTTYAPGSDYTIKVSSAADGNIFGESEQFTISEASGSIGSVTDIDANTYATIKIGAQWWMAENLKVTQYWDGTAITNVIGDANWAALLDENNLAAKAYSWYADAIANKDVYGALYTWAAASNGINSTLIPSGVQGICPTGWHLPSEAEWNELTDYLGGLSVAGGKMKTIGTIQASTGLWEDPNTGASNESGFSGLPGGYRSYSNGTFLFNDTNGYWWSTNESGSNAWYRALNYLNDDAATGTFAKSTGLYVRCVKD